MSRVEDWPERLLETVDAAKVQPFGWGIADCITFALDCARAVRGGAVGPVIPPYATEAGADAALATLGFAALSDAFAAHLEECPVAMAGRGDIGIVENGGRGCAVVCTGVHWAGRTETGVIFFSLHHVTRAFRI